MQKNIPAVSIIIPMYNAEKYIGECLSSIFAQTFTYFEVIVVDDCSTDKSCDIVEDYIQNHTEGQLRLIRRKINSGNPAAPTNEGLTFSRGEYVFLLDNDDLITPTALAELYPLAKKFDADVVHCERYFQFKNGSDARTLQGYQSGELVKEPTLLTNDILKRVVEVKSGRFLWNLWSKLIRRDFLFENHIEMIDVMAQDVLYTWCIALTAKKYLRVPNVVNIYRIREDSLFHKKENVSKIIHMRVYAVAEGFKRLNEFLNGIEIFRQRPDVKYSVLEHWISTCCNFLQEIYAKIPAFQLNALIQKEFDGNDLMTFIFSRMNVFNVNMNRQEAVIQQMKAYIQQQQTKINELQMRLEDKEKNLE